MPAVGLEPISKFDMFGLYSDIVGFCSDIFGFSYPFIFLRYPLEGTHYATRNATRKKYNNFLYSVTSLTKYLYHPNSVPNHPKIIPTQKGYYIILESWILGHFGRSRTFSDIFGKICYQIPLFCDQSALFCEVMALLRFRSKTRNYHATITQLRHIDKLQAS